MTASQSEGGDNGGLINPSKIFGHDLISILSINLTAFFGGLPPEISGSGNEGTCRYKFNYAPAGLLFREKRQK